MSDELDPRARELLAEVVTGGRAPEDPAVLARASADPAFRERLRELSDAAQLLDDAARDARETRRAAAALHGAPGEDSLARALAPARPGLRRRALGLALAAAAAALALFLVSRSRDERASPVWLGPEEVRLVRPIGRVDSYSPIEWQGRLSPRGEYRIRITDAAAADGEALLEERTTGTRWTPSAEQLAQLPARVWVEVTVWEDGARASDSAEAWR